MTQTIVYSFHTTKQKEKSKMSIVYLGAGMFCTASILYMATALATYISICKDVPASKKFYFFNVLAQVEIIIMLCGCLIMVGGVFYVLLTDPMILI